MRFGRMCCLMITGVTALLASHNGLVAGSIPARRTREINDLEQFLKKFNG